MTAAAKVGWKVAVVGGGRWARALALAFSPNRGGTVSRIWQVRPARAPEAAAPAANEALGAVEVTADAAVLREADLIVLAVPAAAARQRLREAGPLLHGGQVLIHAIGSLEPNASALTPISEVVRQETPVRRIGALAGPALAQDLEEGRPAALLCGSRYDDVGAALVEALSTRSVRVYTTRDIRGVELARALVAAVALAGGVAEALSLGAAARAILVVRGAAEMARLGVALGAQERTFFGLAGVGELVVATEGRGSADFELGLLLGRGVPLAEAERRIGRTVDGPTMVREGLRLAQQHHVRMTLLTALSRWFDGERDTKAALRDLFAGPDHAE